MADAIWRDPNVESVMPRPFVVADASGAAAMAIATAQAKQGVRTFYCFRDSIFFAGEFYALTVSLKCRVTAWADVAGMRRVRGGNTSCARLVSVGETASECRLNVYALRRTTASDARPFRCG